jgi:LDH2 family malate/lactate/ureidoglycolate dehydrogenase
MRYSADDLRSFAQSLLENTGLDHDKSRDVADVLLEGDLLGHTTHGLALLPSYLADLEKGAMAKTGEPQTIADLPAAVTWDGCSLPGPWLVRRALALATGRAAAQGSCTVVIRRSHHIACLAAYLAAAAESGFVVILSCSDPTVATVAPYGGAKGVMTPNPIAAAWPTKSGVVMFDTSMSITANAMVRRYHDEKRRLPGKWLVDADGAPTDNPAVLFETPRGALLPIGGVDHGHKGYALGLLVEALTNGLGGFGRSERAEGWTASVFLQVLQPSLFGGAEPFLRETTHLAETCKSCPPRAGAEPVRLPGEAALARRRAQLARGVELHPGILPALASRAGQLRVPVPLDT